MPIKFTHEAQLAGRTVTVESDDFPDLLRAIAGIEELNRDARYLHGRIKKEDGKPPQKLALAFRKDAEENEYYGFEEVTAGGAMPRNVTFGKKRDQTAIIPFFPKGDEGYYDPSQNGQSRRRGGSKPQQGSQRGGQQSQQRPPRGQQSGQGEPLRQKEGQQATPRHNEGAKKQEGHLPF